VKEIINSWGLSKSCREGELWPDEKNERSLIVFVFKIVPFFFKGPILFFLFVDLYTHTHFHLTVIF
jgi:hypothetical protein